MDSHGCLLQWNSLSARQRRIFDDPDGLRARGALKNIGDLVELRRFFSRQTADVSVCKELELLLVDDEAAVPLVLLFLQSLLHFKTKPLTAQMYAAKEVGVR